MSKRLCIRSAYWIAKLPKSIRKMEYSQFVTSVGQKKIWVPDGTENDDDTEKHFVLVKWARV